jgi:hypothetical protein
VGELKFRHDPVELALVDDLGAGAAHVGGGRGFAVAVAA